MISISSHFSHGKLIEQDEYHSIYQLNLFKGNGTATVYPILSGIEVVLLDFRAPRYLSVIHGNQNILEINYCLSGRTECKMQDGCLQYIGEGDLFLNTLHNHSNSMERMTGELSHRFTIEELAREYGISVTALKTHFKGVYGQSISTFMKEYRIRRAAALLRETDQSVADIALSVGYESQSKFGAAFKNAIKLTPLEYRKKMEE